jgi:NAD(P)-dependent dehydrogenase (short-subunit alcohol dehydrogenase family)
MPKVAIITGASRGIGATTARLAARDGYDVCVNYATDLASARAVVKACQAAGRRAIAVRADIAKPEDVEAMFDACDKQLGPASLLVNNAGVVGTATTVAELPDDALRETFEVNVFGSIFCARAAIRRMSIARGGAGGVIVNVSSIAANLGSPGEYVHYAASKAAIDGFTIGLAKEVGPEGIRVNAVQAGTTDTGIHAKAGNPDRPALVVKLAPLRRIATPEDTAEAILYLASDKAGYATGAILRIGGGL